MSTKASRFAFEYRLANPDRISDYYRKNLSPIKFASLKTGQGISNKHVQFGVSDWQVWGCSSSSGMTLSYRDVPKPYGHVLYATNAGQMKIEVGQNTYVSESGSFFIGRLDRFDRVVMTPGRSHLAVSFNASAIKRHLSHVLDDEISREIAFAEALATDSIAGRQLQGFLQFVWRQVQDESRILSPGFYVHLMNAFTAMLLEAAPSNFSGLLSESAPAALPRQLRRAIDFMHAHMTEDLTIADIAKAAGTSVRSLQVSFRQYHDSSPLAYLRSLKLKGVYAALRDPHNHMSVKETAASWGFTHLGRFSRTYLEAFGEKPSDTLRLRRQHE